MNSNPTGEPTTNGTTDQFTRAAQDTHNLAAQSATEQSTGRIRTHHRPNDAADLDALEPHEVVSGVVSGDGPGAVDPHVEIVLHAERLLVSRARYATERVRFSKQIVTTTRTIEIPVRIEQLVISHEPFPSHTPADTLAAIPTTTVVSDPTATVPVDALVGVDGEGEGALVIVLHEEVPEFTLRVTPVERVTVEVRTVVAEQTITATLGTETVSVDQRHVG